MKTYKYIKQNGGATLTPQGQPLKAGSGYMVAIQGYESIHNMQDKKAVSKKLKRLKAVARSIGGYVGAWIDSGKIYLDISVHILEQSKALSIAKDNKQLAIYDLEKNNSIYL